MKTTIIIFGIAVFVFFFFKFFANREVDKIEEMKKYPLKYAYYVYPTGVSRSLVSGDKDCMDLIKKYYENLSRGIKGHVPGCFEHSIPLNEKVHVLSIDNDSLYAKVAFFYKRPNGTERHLVGYLLKNNLQEIPYRKK